jgi:hypothetical protein
MAKSLFSWLTPFAAFSFSAVTVARVVVAVINVRLLLRAPALKTISRVFLTIHKISLFFSPMTVTQ